MRASRRLVTKALQLLILNCGLFVGYRVLFLREFAGGETGWSVTLLHGLRLDAALLAMELITIAVITVIRRRVRGGFVLGLLWACTLLNAASLVANFLFFRERNQHLWEMLLANIGRPDELYAAVEPFLDLHPMFFVALVAGILAIVLVARRHATLPAHEAWDLWRRPAFAAALGVVLGGLAVNLEAIPDQHGGHIGFTSSKYYMDLPDYVLNQAVVNPLFDLIRYYVPSMLTTRHYKLDAPQALHASRKLMALPPPLDDRYPLLRMVHGEGGLGIESVVLLQVESLGTNVLERRVDGEWVMPYLHQLAEQSLYFPNVIQSFCATDGSTFATATSLHRTFGPSQGRSHFLPTEVNGHFGCLARVIGSRTHRHFFFEGFRQRSDDFVSFMNNQGYDAIGYRELHERLGDRAARESNDLGIYDGPLLREVAATLVATPGPFTAYVATATSHSPWRAPDDMPSRLDDPGLNTFRYTDQSVQAFVEALRARPDFDRTLFVIYGDHTGITFGSGLLERIRVPLILYNTALARQRGRWVDRTEAWASHVDILPTVLALLDGPHPYSGMGTSLLDAPPDRGLISSSFVSSFYIKDGYALKYAPRGRDGQLFPIVDGEIVHQDVSAEHPDVVARLKREFLALYETSDRLVREKRVFPLGEVTPLLADARP